MLSLRLCTHLADLVSSQLQPHGSPVLGCCIHVSKNKNHDAGDSHGQRARHGCARAPPHSKIIAGLHQRGKCKMKQRVDCGSRHSRFPSLLGTISVHQQRAAMLTRCKLVSDEISVAQRLGLTSKLDFSQYSSTVVQAAKTGRKHPSKIQ